jgi:hypothetical protein
MGWYILGVAVTYFIMREVPDLIGLGRDERDRSSALVMSLLFWPFILIYLILKILGIIDKG